MAMADRPSDHEDYSARNSLVSLPDRAERQISELLEPSARRSSGIPPLRRAWSGLCVTRETEMKRAFFVGIVLATGALSGTACGDDDEGDDGGNNNNDENVECNPGEGGVCQNDMDCVVVENGEARASARTCGLG